MNRPEPKPIGRLIVEMVENLGMTDELKRRKVESMWADFAGRGVASFTRSVRMDGATLHVTLSSAPLKEELAYVRESLRQRINAAMGEDIVANIAIH